MLTSGQEWSIMSARELNGVIMEQFDEQKAHLVLGQGT